MSIKEVPVQRPQRWDAPFSADMTDNDVERLLTLAPFCAMNAEAFSSKLSLRGILKYDCRINRYKAGDIVIRQGDYGSSAFLILRGDAIVTLNPLPADFADKPRKTRRSLLNSVSRLWRRNHVAEMRELPGEQPLPPIARGEGAKMRLFLQDIPGTIDISQTFRLQTGQLFGELAALTRTPRSATVIADGPGEMLELRWQGLRDLMKRDNALRNHVDSLYRRNSLRGHLQQTPFLAELDERWLQEVANETLFETYGDFEWNRQFQSLSQRDIADRIQSEPVIAMEGGLADSLLLIRNGFARLSRQHGDGHQTIAYLGKGQVFGMRELTHNWRNKENRPWTLTLRAVGYVDILRIPRLPIEQFVLPNVPESSLPASFAPLATNATKHDLLAENDRRANRREAQLETGLLEFLVDGRFINGTSAMVIDLDRCTRCDDCVRACAATHDNNPRFLREGPRYENWMIAGACMHCLDPVCMIGCPTGAIGRNESSGNVLINDNTCIGCGTCAASCPYSNIKMVDIRCSSGKPIVDAKRGETLQKATKCDFCEGLSGGPACQRACPHDALVRVDLTHPLPLFQIIQTR